MRKIDLHQIMDHAKFGALHRRVLFWCALILIIDGYDVQLAGIALPAIMKDMHVTSAQTGILVSSGLVGMTVGSMILGMLADRMGRRWTIAGSVVIFSTFTAATALASSPVMFAVLRFIAGVGLGGVLPSVVAQMTEYSPLKRRATLVTLAFCGPAAGGILAAVLGKGLLSEYGWQSVFLAAGLPILMLPMMLKSLPESLPYLLKNRRMEVVQRIVQQIEPGYEHRAGDEFVFASPVTSAAPVRQLFAAQRGWSTVMFWVAMFMCLFVISSINASLTRLLGNAGYSMGSALSFVLAMNLGAMVGTLGGGWAADKIDLKRLVIFMYAVGIGSLALLGSLLGSAQPYLLMLVLIGVIGATTIGTQLMTVVYTSVYYPPAIRTTGIGLAGGVGRCGAIVAPLAAGWFLAMEFSPAQSMMAVAAPAMVGLIAITLIDRRHSAAAAAGRSPLAAPH